jgi:hypothetical protein
MHLGTALLTVWSILGLTTALFIPPATEGPCPSAPPEIDILPPGTVLPPNFLNNILNGTQYGVSSYKLLDRSMDHNSKHHGKKHKHKTSHLSGAEKKAADDLKKYLCFEGHTYPNTEVTAWVRRSKISVLALSDSCSVSLKDEQC